MREVSCAARMACGRARAPKLGSTRVSPLAVVSGRSAYFDTCLGEFAARGRHGPAASDRARRGHWHAARPLNACCEKAPPAFVFCARPVAASANASGRNWRCCLRCSPSPPTAAAPGANACFRGRAGGGACRGQVEHKLPLDVARRGLARHVAGAAAPAYEPPVGLRLNAPAAQQQQLLAGLGAILGHEHVGTGLHEAVQRQAVGLVVQEHAPLLKLPRLEVQRAEHAALAQGADVCAHVCDRTRYTHCS